MSKIEQLIQELCPGGVEYSKLRDIGKVCMCKRIMKEQTSSSGDVPFYKIGTFGGNADAFISQDLFDTYKGKYSYPQKGDVLISAAGTIGRTIVFDGEPAYFQDSNIVWLKHDGSKVLNSYLRYCYSLNPWAVSTGGTVARLYNDNILNAIIPLPPLPIQQEIVRILDTFTEAQANLEQELELRKKQYEYYRNQLLTFDENDPSVKWIRLEDVVGKKGYIRGPFGSALKRGEMKPSGIPVYEQQHAIYDNRIFRFYIDKEKYGKLERFTVKPNDLIISCSGTVGEVSIIKENDEIGIISQALLILRPDVNLILSEFLRHYLKTERGRNSLLEGAAGSAQINLAKRETVINMQLPLLSINDQKKIITIIEQFESAIQTLEEELALRKKQYEYYREKLLTFKSN
ncbi:MAG: restriction endonuclease subunit S [Bacteroidales bacterium]|nr:restriction endonuclease subunit S [Bacteroidales bacterium]